MPDIAFIECSRCHAYLSPAAPHSACHACGAVFSHPDQHPADGPEVERDHRGFQLPAKSRVGGIITPQ